MPAKKEDVNKEGKKTEIKNKVKTDTETKDEIKVENETKKSQKKKRELQETTMVNCMNNTVGGLTYRSEYGGRGFRSEGYGKRIRIRLQDLESLYNEQPAIIDEGWLVILDEDVIEHMYLNDLYENIISPKDVDNFIRLPEDDIREKLKNAPHSMKATIYKVLKQKVKDGDQKLNYVPTRRFFEDVLGKKFED